MTLEELFQHAEPQQLHEHIVSQLKDKPGDLSLRSLFVQVLCLEGEWERALKQTDALMKLHPETAIFCCTTTELIHAEQLREHIFAGNGQPLFFGSPEPWISPMLKALPLYAKGQTALATALSRQALDAMPEMPANINGDTHVPWILDGDARLGGVLEIMMRDHYYWLELSKISSLQLAQPSHPIEVCWMQARLTMRTGEIHTVRMPSRYPFATPHQEEEPALLMAKETSWEETTDSLWLGQGLRGWATPETVIPMMNIRQMQL